MQISSERRSNNMRRIACRPTLSRSGEQRRNASSELFPVLVQPSSPRRRYKNASTLTKRREGKRLLSVKPRHLWEKSSSEGAPHSRALIIRARRKKMMVWSKPACTMLTSSLLLFFFFPFSLGTFLVQVLSQLLDFEGNLAKSLSHCLFPLCNQHLACEKLWTGMILPIPIIKTSHYAVCHLRISLSSIGNC